jgi:hypothetical protein
LTSFTALGGDPHDPPNAQDALDAKSVLAALALLGDNDPATVAGDPDTYSPEEVKAAKTVLDSKLDADSAQAILDQLDAWTAYQKSAQEASDSFVAASVSYHGSADLDALRKTVDGVIAQKALDTSALCGTSVASAQ